jgi:hypothetical protein
MLNLSFISTLKKFSGMSLSQLSMADIAEVAGMFGLRIDEHQGAELLEMFKQDDDEAVTEWILRPENQSKILGVIKVVPSKEVINCPTCNEMALYDPREIPNINPHVLCKICGAPIDLSIDPSEAAVG